MQPRTRVLKVTKSPVNPWQAAHRAAKLALLGLAAAVLVACGGGGGSAPGELPNANNLAPANVKLLEVSSAAVGQITASWLPATDDATPVANLTYQLHASTDAAFTPSASTKVFEGQAVYQATVSSGLTAGSKYTFKLLVVDGQGASASSEGLSVTVSNTAVTLNAGVKVATLETTQVASISGNQLTLQAGVANVQVGQFIASANLDSTSNGYLKKVESVTTSNGQTVLQTRDASLNEVVSDVKVSSSFRMESVSEQVASTAQQTGLARVQSSSKTQTSDFSWPQSGYRYSTVPVATATQTTLQVGLSESMARVENSGDWSKIIAPAQVTLNEKETGQFNLNLNVFKGVQSGGTTKWIRELCKVEFGAVWGKGDDSQPKGIHLSQGAWNIVQSTSGHAIAATVPVNISADQGVAHINPYKVKATLHIDEIGSGCKSLYIGTETVDVTIEIKVVNDTLPKAEKSIKTVANASGSLSITNDLTVNFDPEIIFDKTISGTKLTYATVQLQASPKIIQTLNVKATGQGNLDSTIDLIAPRTFAKIYLAGGMPILIRGKFKLQAQIVGSATGALSATEQLTMGYDQLKTGFIYQNGQFTTVNEKSPVYQFKVGGQGDASATVEIRLQPSLEMTAYELTTGKVMLEPYINANAALQGHVQLDAQVNPVTGLVDAVADADYRLKQADLRGGLRAFLFASLHVYDYNLWTWPENATLNNRDSHKQLDLIAETPIIGIPNLAPVAETSLLARAVHPSDSRALRVRASATNLDNPLNLPAGYVINWAGWTPARIVPPLGVSTGSYSLLSETESASGEAWAIFQEPGTYVVRQGGYSSLGAWARQYIETTITIADANSNGIPDWWEQRYALTGSGAAIATADADSDGLTNLQEWNAGSDPTVKNGSNDVVTLNANPNNSTVGQAVELWITTAWTAIKQVFWSFSDGLTSLAATVSDGISQKVTAVFATAGSKTVTATFKDASGNVLGSQSQTLTVLSAISSNPSVRIAGVIADSGSPTGAVPDQGTMSDNTPGLAGIVSADLSSLQSVRVYNGSTLLGTATVSGAAWTLQLPALADGTYVFRPVVYHAGTMTEGASENTWTVTIKTATSGGSGKLPHSGITASQCYSAGSNTLMTCSGVANDLNAQQDGHRASINPMSYSLVPKTGGGTYDKTECVKDDVTGLIWEGKTASGTRSGSNTYTNFDSSATGNKQNNGSDAAAAQVAAATNSMGYVTAVNAAALCGYTDWRLPTVDELQTIVDYSKPYPGPTINAAWFPNTPSYSYYWSSSRTVGGSHAAWVVHFYDGGILSNLRGYDDHVRLVRASQ